MKIEIKYKPIGHCFIANWFHLKLYPRFWLNEVKNTPNFKHWSFSIRFLWWMFGIERKYKHVYSAEETYYFNIEANKPDRNTECYKRVEREKEMSKKR